MQHEPPTKSTASVSEMAAKGGPEWRAWRVKEVTDKLTAEQGEEGKGNRKDGDDCESRKGGEKNKGVGVAVGGRGFRVMMSWVESLWESCQCQLPLSSYFLIIPLRHKTGFLQRSL